MVLHGDCTDDAARVVSDEIGDHGDVLAGREIDSTQRVAIVNISSRGTVGSKLFVDDVDRLASGDAPVLIHGKTSLMLSFVGIILALPTPSEEAHGRKGEDDCREKRSGDLGSLPPG